MKEIYYHNRHKDGGVHEFTLCGIKHEQDLGIGIAVCSSKEKNFVKKTGRAISFRRTEEAPMIVIRDFFKDKCEEDHVKAVVVQLLTEAEKLDQMDIRRKVEKRYHTSKVNNEMYA